MDGNSFKGRIESISSFKKGNLISTLNDNQKENLKNEIIDLLKKLDCSEKLIDDAINFINPNKFNLTDVKKYDVIYLMNGPQPHYCVVFKVVGDNVFSIPISSQNNTLGLTNKCIAKSRMFKTNFVPKIELCSLKMAITSFKFIYDGNKKEFDNFVKEVKKSYLKMLK